MGDLTPHFSRWEFQSRDGAELVGPTMMLLGVLENLRGQRHGPVTIVSGHRSIEHNTSVGGAGDSRHLHGDAADIEPGWCSVAMAEEAGAVGIGTSGEWVTHVDTRPGGPARWSYT